MARNKIQFQKGLSFKEFHKNYGTEAKCRRVLFKWKWADGFICPKCGATRYWMNGNRHLYQCTSCRFQVSLRAGTIFQSSKLPLTTWFLGIYLNTQSKTGISALEMSRHLGISYNAAWRMKHKLMHVMLEKSQSQKLAGKIELDDSYMGGECSGEKRGRGTPGKTPFLAAVEKNAMGHPIRVVFMKVSGFTYKEIWRWGTRHMVVGSTVTTDGFQCFNILEEMGFNHITEVVGSHRQAAKNPTFFWINTVLGNLKKTVKGTYQSIKSKYVSRYLAEFQYRFNSRFDLKEMFRSLTIASLNTFPVSESNLRLPEEL